MYSAFLVSRGQPNEILNRARLSVWANFDKIIKSLNYFVLYLVLFRPLALVFNILYYVLHPSKVTLHQMFWISILFQVNVTNIKEKCVVALFGKKIHLSLCCSVTEDLDEKEDKVENPLQKIEMAPLNSGHDNLEEVISTDK